MKNIFKSEDVGKFVAMIENHDRIVLTCHMRPDGDAVGSTLGLYHLLKGLGKDVNVVVPDRVPRSLQFLPGVKEIAVFTQYDPYCTRLIQEAQLIIMCDFNTMTRQGDLADTIRSAECRKILIDHHRDPDIECNICFSYPEMSSTCELVFRLIAAAGLYSYVNLECATCILAGIITDTRNFTVNCDNPEIYEIMIRLLEKGVDKKRIIDEALEATSYEALKLKSYALLERLEISEQSRCALIVLSKDDLNRFDYQKGDTEGLVNMPLNIRGVVYSIFMREDTDCVKVSARSKFDFPVCDICRDLFNGGGHLMAAGGEFYGSIGECVSLFKERMHDYDKYLPHRLEKLDMERQSSNSKD